jgi:glucose-1-phosphate thymidylyltransferase
MKGIILAGGSGSRLLPLTLTVSKQLLPVYDKPMIYYPLSTLMLSGVRDILVITRPQDGALFRQLLGDGKRWGISLSYAVQPRPEGLAQAFIIGEDFIGSSSVTLILGDNLFFEQGLGRQLQDVSFNGQGATIFAHMVSDPGRYGVVTLDKDRRAIDIEEKPRRPRSSYAVTGLYFYDNDVVAISKALRPSARGELEITDVNRAYLTRGDLRVRVLDRGTAWLDMGSHESLLRASNFVKGVETHHGTKLGCVEEVAWQLGWIDSDQLLHLAEPLAHSSYGLYLREILEQEAQLRQN